MGGADQLDAALGDGAGGLGLQLGPDLVDDDDLGHVVLDRLDHHRVLERRACGPACGGRDRWPDAGCRRRRRSRWRCRRRRPACPGRRPGRGPPRAASSSCRCPGRPRMRIDFPDSTKSSMISIVPKTARPTRQVRPTILPVRLRMALMRWSVRSMPARLSSPNVPMWSTTYSMSASVISRSSRVDLAVREAGLGLAAEVHHDLDQLGRVGQGVDGGDDVRRQGAAGADPGRRSTRAGGSPRPDQPRLLLPLRLAYRRDECGFGHADDGLLHQEGHRVEVGEAGLLEAAIDRAIRRFEPAPGPRCRGSCRPGRCAPRAGPARSPRSGPRPSRAGPGP